MSNKVPVAQNVVASQPVLNQTVQTPATIVKPQFNAPMPWPNYGYAAYGVPKDDLVAGSEENAKPVPVASLAKVITALAIVKQRPLQIGEQGPVYTLTDQDVAIYSDYVRKNGSVVFVESGEQISQYQALQAIMMISANNMADSVVRQEFGSVEAYVAYANAMLKELGLNNTTVSDASGYSPHTVSTAEDMTKLGYLYMQNPVLRQIASQDDAVIPVAGKISNYNSFTNKDGLIGIKVGDTDQAGKCFLIADIRQSSDSKEEISVATVLGATSLKTASKDAQKILKAGNKGHDQTVKP